MCIIKFPKLTKATMNSYDLTKDLLLLGIPRASVDELMRKHTRDARKHEVTKRAHDWDFVLYPLKQQIRALQSSKKRWLPDVHRAPVYSFYLALLLKVRARIEKLRELNFEGKSIPEIAKEKGIPLDGMRWHAYVPENVKERTLLEFQTLYEVTLPDARGEHVPQMNGRERARLIGKRIIPFSAKAERTISDVRWDKLFAKVNSELLGRTGRGTDAETTPIIDALKEALHVINNRSLTDEAPYNLQWEKLLTPHTAQRMEEWLQITTGGLDEEKMLEAQRAQQTDRALALAAKEEETKRKQREYAVKYRAKRKVERLQERSQARTQEPRKAPTGTWLDSTDE